MKMSLDTAGNWIDLLTPPEDYAFAPGVRYIKSWNFETFDAELYLQNNGPGTIQRVMMTFPKKLSGKRPAVAVPFYFPEAMIGFEPDTLEVLPRYEKIAMAKDLAERGFITISADAYHLTFCPEDPAGRDEFSRWQTAGTALKKKYPQWCGCGKLLADTRLLLDMLENDDRVDNGAIGIAGHSLGGKMAFYTGCLDERVKVILASDFGIGWDQTNWRDIWYWGDQVDELISRGMEHSQLLDLAGGKPFMLLAGLYDNAESLEIMQRAASYASVPEHLQIINHATGHRPPEDVLLAGYAFLEKYLVKEKVRTTMNRSLQRSLGAV